MHKGIKDFPLDRAVSEFPYAVPFGYYIKEFHHKICSLSYPGLDIAGHCSDIFLLESPAQLFLSSFSLCLALGAGLLRLCSTILEIGCPLFFREDLLI